MASEALFQQSVWWLALEKTTLDFPQSSSHCLLQDLPYTVFQPLYIYGPYSAKDYMGYFLDRLLRNRPVPIPAPGIQLVSLTHVEDVASMMAKVHAGFPHARMSPCDGSSC